MSSLRQSKAPKIGVINTKGMTRAESSILNEYQGRRTTTKHHISTNGLRVCEWVTPLIRQGTRLWSACDTYSIPTLTFALI